MAPPMELASPALWETVLEVITPHMRNLIQAMLVMVGAWLLIENLMGKLPKNAWGTTVKRVFSVALGIFALIVLEEIVGCVTEMSHHEGSWWRVAWDHKRPIFYGAMAGGLTPYFHPWIKSKMPGFLGGK